MVAARPFSQLVLFALFLLLVTTAAAAAQEQLSTATCDSQVQLVLLLDHSSSIVRNGIWSDALEASNNLIDYVFANMPQSQMAAIVFDDDANVIAEMGNDADAIWNALQAHQTIMTQDNTGGTNIGKALNAAKSAFTSGAHRRVIVLMSDGGSYDNVEQIAKRLIETDKIEIYAIAIGYTVFNGLTLATQDARRIFTLVDVKLAQNAIASPTGIYAQLCDLSCSLHDYASCKNDSCMYCAAQGQCMSMQMHDSTCAQSITTTTSLVDIVIQDARVFIDTDDQVQMRVQLQVRNERGEPLAQFAPITVQVTLIAYLQDDSHEQWSNNNIQIRPSATSWQQGIQLTDLIGAQGLLRDVSKLQMTVHADANNNLVELDERNNFKTVLVNVRHVQVRGCRGVFINFDNNATIPFDLQVATNALQPGLILETTNLDILFGNLLQYQVRDLPRDKQVNVLVAPFEKLNDTSRRLGQWQLYGPLLHLATSNMAENDNYLVTHMLQYQYLISFLHGLYNDSTNYALDDALQQGRCKYAFDLQWQEEYLDMLVPANFLFASGNYSIQEQVHLSVQVHSMAQPISLQWHQLQYRMQIANHIALPPIQVDAQYNVDKQINNLHWKTASTYLYMRDMPIITNRNNKYAAMLPSLLVQVLARMDTTAIKNLQRNETTWRSDSVVAMAPLLALQLHTSMDFVGQLQWQLATRQFVTSSDAKFVWYTIETPVVLVSDQLVTTRQRQRQVPSHNDVMARMATRDYTLLSLQNDESMLMLSLVPVDLARNANGSTVYVQTRIEYVHAQDGSLINKAQQALHSTPYQQMHLTGIAIPELRTYVACWVRVNSSSVAFGKLHVREAFDANYLQYAQIVCQTAQVAAGSRFVWNEEQIVVAATQNQVFHGYPTLVWNAQEQLLLLQMIDNQYRQNKWQQSCLVAAQTYRVRNGTLVAATQRTSRKMCDLGLLANAPAVSAIANHIMVSLVQVKGEEYIHEPYVVYFTNNSDTFTARVPNVATVRSTVTPVLGSTSDSLFFMAHLVNDTAMVYSVLDFAETTSDRDVNVRLAHQQTIFSIRDDCTITGMQYHTSSAWHALCYVCISNRINDTATTNYSDTICLFKRPNALNFTRIKHVPLLALSSITDLENDARIAMRISAFANPHLMHMYTVHRRVMMSTSATSTSDNGNTWRSIARPAVLDRQPIPVRLTDLYIEKSILKTSHLDDDAAALQLQLYFANDSLVLDNQNVMIAYAIGAQDGSNMQSAVMFALKSNPTTITITQDALQLRKYRQCIYVYLDSSLEQPVRTQCFGHVQLQNASIAHVHPNALYVQFDIVLDKFIEPFSLGSKLDSYLLINGNTKVALTNKTEQWDSTELLRPMVANARWIRYDYTELMRLLNGALTAQLVVALPREHMIMNHLVTVAVDLDVQSNMYIAHVTNELQQETNVIQIRIANDGLKQFENVQLLLRNGYDTTRVLVQRALGAITPLSAKYITIPWNDTITAEYTIALSVQLQADTYGLVSELVTSLTLQPHGTNVTFVADSIYRTMTDNAMSSIGVQVRNVGANVANDLLFNLYAVGNDREERNSWQYITSSHVPFIDYNQVVTVEFAIAVFELPANQQRMLIEQVSSVVQNRIVQTASSIPIK